jgi:hypothetical protein
MAQGTPSTSANSAALADPGPDGRQALVGAIFTKFDALGFQRLEYELTADAIDLGLNATLPALMPLDYQIGEFGRGERDSGSLTQRPPILLINRTPLRAAAEATA